MTDNVPEPATLETLHRDLQVGFGDVKNTLITGFRNLPGRETAEEMVRLLREGNRIQETRLTVRIRQQHLELGTRIREQHLETQQVLHAVAEQHRETQQVFHAIADIQRALSDDVRRLVAQIRALIRARRNGAPRPRDRAARAPPTRGVECYSRPKRFRRV